MSIKKRVPTDGGESFGHNPFAGLSSEGLPPALEMRPAGPGDPPATQPIAPRKNRGRVDVQRQTAGRGGKTVTVVSGFVGIGLPEKEKLAKQMQKACGVGGTVKDGRIEIQGDKRTEVAAMLTEAGFRPVFTGAESLQSGAPEPMPLKIQDSDAGLPQGSREGRSCHANAQPIVIATVTNMEMIMGENCCLNRDTTEPRRRAVLRKARGSCRSTP